MGDFERDTRCSGAEGDYWAPIAERWCEAGGTPGYLAAIALRAAGASVGAGAPRALSCAYLSAPRPGRVDVLTERSRTAGGPELVEIRIVQRGAVLATAQVVVGPGWETGSGRSPSAADIPALRVPAPSGMEVRDASFAIADRRAATSGAATAQMRLCGPEDFTDPFLDAARQVLFLALAAAEEPTTLMVTLHRPTPDAWVQWQAEPPAVADGWPVFSARLYDSNGALVACAIGAGGAATAGVSAWRAAAAIA